ncbi:PaaI family thioesterase [Pyruvatibacter mobilis]|uniref:PaaI family thioesterase n=1 Tax=Pyruvatibacter mobilis TaxID=1712261 RepID=UPI003BAF71DD
MSTKEQDQAEALRHALIDHVPHAQAIGLEVVYVKKAKACLKVPYAPHLVGNPDTGVVHGGVITTMLDNACGVAVQMALDEPSSIATLDLRIDYMGPATPGRDILGEAHCYKVTKSVAFVRGVAFHDDRDDPIGTCHGAFMLAANRAVAPSSQIRRHVMKGERPNALDAGSTGGEG